MWQRLKRLFLGVPHCRRHTWKRNEHNVLVCTVCGWAAGQDSQEKSWHHY